MSLTGMASACRTSRLSSPLVSARTFSTTPHRRASILFALNALSNSRETQHFNKLTRLDRIEHSPPLKLIKTSEIDPYPLPALPPKPSAAPLVRDAAARSASHVWDDRALRAGRAVLANSARHVSRLQRALQRAKSREARQVVRAQVDKAAWQQEVRRHHGEVRAAGVWILLSIGTATALATWRFWPQQRPTDSADLGRRLAATAQRSMPLPRAAVSDVPSAGVASVGLASASTLVP
ncbi:hypothetical protein LTR53_013278, partial [Teratosphaeriaceae sp. CCFEE 6253]